MKDSEEGLCPEKLFTGKSNTELYTDGCLINYELF